MIFCESITDGRLVDLWPIDVLFPDVVDVDHLGGATRTGLTPCRAESSRRWGIPDAGDG